MNVIGHQAVGIKVKRPLNLLGVQEGEKPEIVFIGPKNAPAIIATSDYVVQAASYLNSRFPCHGPAENKYSEIRMSIFPA